MSKHPTSIRLSETGKRKLAYLATLYGNQTTAIEVAIQALYNAETRFDPDATALGHMHSGEGDDLKK